MRTAAYKERGHVFISMFVLCCLVFVEIRYGCQKRLFFPNEISVSVRHAEISFFYFKLFLRTKASQNAFDFSQIESQACSIF